MHREISNEREIESKLDTPARHSTLLFGATSLLGFNLARSFRQTIVPFVTPGSRARSLRRWPVLKLEDPAWLEAIFERHRPNVLLYGHAVCDVPKCEAAPGWAWEMNVEHVRRVLVALPPTTRFVYVSSDHVFCGDGVYDENSAPCPISAYGRTRVAAEQLVSKRSGSLVIRVGLPIGPSPNGRTGHRDWLRYRIGRHLPVTIVQDEYRSTVWASDLALRVMQLGQSSVTGLRHVTATRAVSRVELASHLLQLVGATASFSRESRHERAAPHIGSVELATIHRDQLSEPLPSVLDAGSSLGSLGDSFQDGLAGVMGRLSQET